MSIRLAIVAALGLTAVFSQAPATRHFKPDPRETDASLTGKLPFQLRDGFLILVQGRVGTRGNLKFILDTGTSKSLIDARLAKKLNLAERRQATGFNYDRTIPLRMVAVPELLIGPIQESKVDLMVGNLSDYSAYAENVDGILGMDLLKSANFTIDYATRKITFRSSVHDGAALPEPFLSSPVVVLQLQGRPVRLVLDTGLQTTVLWQERLEKSVPALRTKGGSSEVTIGRLSARQVVLPEVSIGHATLEMSVLLVKSPPAEILPGIDGVLGVAALKARRVTLDFPGRTLSWENARAGKPLLLVTQLQPF